MSISLLLLILISGCTQAPTNYVISDKNVSGDMTIQGDLFVDGNFYNKMPYLFGVADEEQALLSVGEFQAIDFNYGLGNAYLFSPVDSNCIVVEKNGHYMVDFEAHFADSAANPVSVVALRISQNGLEVSGSYAEISMFKQDAEQEITTFGYVDVVEDDVLCMEWTSSHDTVSLDNDNAYALQHVTAKGFITWIHD